MWSISGKDRITSICYYCNVRRCHYILFSVINVSCSFKCPIDYRKELLTSFEYVPLRWYSRLGLIAAWDLVQINVQLTMRIIFKFDKYCIQLCIWQTYATRVLQYSMCDSPIKSSDSTRVKNAMIYQVYCIDMFCNINFTSVCICHIVVSFCLHHDIPTVHSVKMYATRPMPLISARYCTCDTLVTICRDFFVKTPGWRNITNFPTEERVLTPWRGTTLRAINWAKLK